MYSSCNRSRSNQEAPFKLDNALYIPRYPATDQPQPATPSTMHDPCRFKPNAEGCTPIHGYTLAQCRRVRHLRGKVNTAWVRSQDGFYIGFLTSGKHLSTTVLRWRWCYGLWVRCYGVTVAVTQARLSPLGLGWPLHPTGQYTLPLST